VAALNPQAIDIPSFQRGISWQREQLQTFVESDSILLGSATLAQLPGQPEYQLVDGLQRFAAGTALLSIIDPLLLSATPSDPINAPSCQLLKAAYGGYLAVVQHNNNALLHHPRLAIASQYKELRRIAEEYIQESLATSPNAFTKRLVELFYQKQIAPDLYTGFLKAIELAHTFIGLNTVRLELGPMDIVRALIIDAALGQHWPASNISDAENKLTEVFTTPSGQPNSDLLPIATVVQRLLEADGTSAEKPTQLFPSWPAITDTQVMAFLGFIEDCLDAADVNPFLGELYECGRLPFSFATLHYARQFMISGQAPSFLSGGAVEDKDLLLLLRASYRALIDGSLGKSGHIGVGIFTGDYPTLPDAARALCPSASGTLALAPGNQWLRAQLDRCDIKRSRRVFNACLLPVRNTSTLFQPITYGKKAIQHQIDHLIPKANVPALSPGSDRVDSLRNLAPLPQPLNKTASNMICSVKLAAGGPYTQPGAVAHPYAAWLSSVQGGLASALDDPARLSSDIGTARLDVLATWLCDRL
jgi:hypothetical protein